MCRKHQHPILFILFSCVLVCMSFSINRPCLEDQNINKSRKHSTAESNLYVHEACEIFFMCPIWGKTNHNLHRTLVSNTRRYKTFRVGVFSYLFCHLYPPKSDSTWFENAASWEPPCPLPQTGETGKEHTQNTMDFFNLWVIQRKHLLPSQNTLPVNLSQYLG